MLKVRSARGLVKEIDHLSKAFACRRTSSARYPFGQSLIHFSSTVSRFLKPKRFNFGFRQRIKARQKLRRQFRPFVHGERQRLADDGRGVHQ